MKKCTTLDAFPTPYWLNKKPTLIRVDSIWLILKLLSCTLNATKIFSESFSTRLHKYFYQFRGGTFKFGSGTFPICAYNDPRWVIHQWLSRLTWSTSELWRNANLRRHRATLKEKIRKPTAPYAKVLVFSLTFQP